MIITAGEFFVGCLVVQWFINQEKRVVEASRVTEVKAPAAAFIPAPVIEPPSASFYSMTADLDALGIAWSMTPKIL